MYIFSILVSVSPSFVIDLLSGKIWADSTNLHGQESLFLFPLQIVVELDASHLQAWLSWATRWLTGFARCHSFPCGLISWVRIEARGILTILSVESEVLARATKVCTKSLNNSWLEPIFCGQNAFLLGSSGCILRTNSSLWVEVGDR